MSDKDKKHYILIVEDETELNNLLTELSLSLGYEVQQCYNGREALDFLLGTESMPVLVMCDITMPQMSGLEFIKYQLAKNLNLNICVLTSDLSNECLVQSLQLGVTDYILKPFNMGDLCDKIARLAEFGKRRLEVQSIESQIPEVAKAKHQDNMFRIINSTKKAS